MSTQIIDPPWNSAHRFTVSIRPSGTPAHMTGICLQIPVSASLQCSWKPLLSPEANYVVGDKVFRSPTIILEDDSQLVALIPDINHIASNRSIPHVMDYESSGNVLMYGLCNYQETGHVYHALQPRTHECGDVLSFEFDVVQLIKPSMTRTRRDFRPVEEFIWKQYAQHQMAGDDSLLPDPHQLQKYVDYTYDWAHLPRLA